MSVEELNEYQTICKSIVRLKARLEELDSSALSAVKFDKEVSFKNVGKPTERIALLKTEITTELNKELEKLLIEEKKINDFIKTIEDKNIKLLVRLRYLEGREWEEIGNMLNCHRTTCLKQLNGFLANLKKEGVEK